MPIYQQSETLFFFPLWPQPAFEVHSGAQSPTYRLSQGELRIHSNTLAADVILSVRTAQRRRRKQMVFQNRKIENPAFNFPSTRESMTQEVNTHIIWNNSNIQIWIWPLIYLTAPTHASPNQNNNDLLRSWTVRKQFRLLHEGLYVLGLGVGDTWTLDISQPDASTMIDWIRHRSKLIPNVLRVTLTDHDVIKW